MLDLLTFYRVFVYRNESIILTFVLNIGRINTMCRSS